MMPVGYAVMSVPEAPVVTGQRAESVDVLAVRVGRVEPHHFRILDRRPHRVEVLVQLGVPRYDVAFPAFVVL